MWKKTDDPPEKMSLFLDMNLHLNRMNNPFYKFYMKKGVLALHRVMSSILNFLRRITDFGRTLISRFLRVLCIVFTDAYNVQVLLSWQRWIGIDCILPFVKFEGGLFISVLRKKATLYKKLGLKTDEFSKVKKFPNNRHQPPVLSDSPPQKDNFACMHLY
jgi:hypothetical protein